mmetsp:Transcript_8877/g.13592  ORF Transcript_8877/g.13592 Transcript_8877/m.13592 type:complete len:110 (-) Transcript_8877:309-638(-)
MCHDILAQTLCWSQYLGNLEFPTVALHECCDDSQKWIPNLDPPNGAKMICIPEQYYKHDRCPRFTRILPLHTITMIDPEKGPKVHNRFPGAGVFHQVPNKQQRGHIISL